MQKDDQLEIVNDYSEPIRMEIANYGAVICLTDIWFGCGQISEMHPEIWKSDPSIIATIGQISAQLKIPIPALYLPHPNNNKVIWGHWAVAQTYCASYGKPNLNQWFHNLISPILSYQNTVLRSAVPSYIAELSAQIENGFLSVQEQSETQFNNISHQVAQISGRRREITKSTRDIITEATHNLGGKCPFCKEAQVTVDKETVLKPAEFDHYYGSQYNTSNYVWLICKTCHNKLTYKLIDRKESDGPFREFQNSMSQQIL